MTPREVLDRVDAELRALWSPASTDTASAEVPKARACTTNLVVVAPTPDRAAAWVPIIDEVVQIVPARAIVIGLDPDGADALEATVSAVCSPGSASGGGSSMCSERIVLVARGGVCARVPSVASSLCLSSVPTTLVWLGGVHADDPAFAPLAPEASRIVLDSSHGTLASLANAVYWARARAEADRPCVADLAWTGLAQWQEQCARMFDEPRLRALASRVTKLTLVQASARGEPLAADGALLLGWLATRLAWKAAPVAGKLRLVRADGGAVAVALKVESAAGAGGEARDTLRGVRIEAGDAALALRGEIARDAEAATWSLEVTAGGATPQRIEQRVRLRDHEAASLLESTLRRPTRDDALIDAVAWADELRGEELACG